MYNYKVNNLKSDRGNSIANQFKISVDNKVIFQSYDSLICVIDFGEHIITLGQDWDYSRTTSKYLYQFLRDNFIDVNSKKELQQLINDGIYKSRFDDWKIVYDERLI